MSYIEIYADSARGIYIPQYFAESAKREMVQGVNAEEWAILESGPDNAEYWDVWESVLNNAKVTDSRGEWTLYQDGDLWICHADYLQEESAEELSAVINEICAERVTYETTHKDAGDSYAHLPYESWSSAEEERLGAFMAEKGIDACGLELDEIAELALDAFEMTPSHMFAVGNDNAFMLACFPIGEIELQIDFAELSERVGFDVKAAHIEQLKENHARDVESYIGSIERDSFLAYVNTDSTWEAEIDAEKLRQLIAEEAESRAE